jgi:lysophospholipase L1-like esterase
MPSTRSQLVALALLTTLAAGPACGEADEATAVVEAQDEPPTPVVAIVGDSITAGAAGTLHDALDDDTDLHVRGTSGALTSQMLDDSAELAEREPDVVVVNLGTNDATTPGSSDVTEAALRDHLDLFEAASCRYLVTITEEPDLAGYAETAAATNRRIRALAEEVDRVEVIDWQATLAAERAEDPPEGPLLSDDIHPTPRGNDVLVATIAEAVARPCDDA